jgi:hypothetical protein
MVLTASLFWLTVAANSPKFGEFALAGGGALAWGSPICLFIGLRPGAPLILGNECTPGFTPTEVPPRRILS